MRQVCLSLTIIIMLVFSGCSDATLKPNSSIDRLVFLSNKICSVKLEYNECETLPGKEYKNKMLITGLSDIKKQKIRISFKYDKNSVAVESDDNEIMIDNNKNYEVEFKLKIQRKPNLGNTTVKCKVENSRGQVINACDLRIIIRLFSVRSSEGQEFFVLPPGSFRTDLHFNLSSEHKQLIKTTIVSELPKGFNVSLDLPVLTPNYIEPVKEPPKRERSRSDSEGEDERPPNYDKPNTVEAVFETTEEIKSGNFFIYLEFESDGYKETMKLKVNVVDFNIVCREDSKFFTQDKITYNIDIIPRSGFKGKCVPIIESLPKGVTPIFSENPIIIDNKEKSFDVILEFLPGMQGIFTPLLKVENENGYSAWMLIARKGSYDIQVYPPVKGSYRPGAEVDWTIMIGSLSEKPAKLYIKISDTPKGWIVKQASNTLSEGNSLEPVEIGKEKEITVMMGDDVFVTISIVIPIDSDMDNTRVRFEIRDGDNIRVEDLSKDYVLPDHNL